MTTRSQRAKLNATLEGNNTPLKASTPLVARDVPPVKIFNKSQTQIYGVTPVNISIALVLRILLVILGEFLDRHLQVQYTDVDYRVFTDAARYVSKGSSPYLRSTYRYSPLIAYVCLPNIFVHETFAKFLFCIVDVVTCYVVNKIALLFSTPKLAHISTLIWLFNPISIVISTRGNSDSIICLFVLLTLFSRLKGKTLLTGVFLAFSIHLRMYPLLFSLPLFLSLKGWKERTKLVLSCVATLGVLTGGFFYLYKDLFLSEAYLYHLTRNDVKHNYSVHFLLQYLSTLSPILKFGPSLILQTLCAIRFYNVNDLPLCLFLQTYLFVTFSPVLTCQYFIWYMSLFIPLLPQFVNTHQLFIRFGLWFIVQLAWLVPAYYLEYQSVNLFYLVGFMCALFFVVNVHVIGKLIEFYQPMKKIA